MDKNALIDLLGNGGPELEALKQDSDLLMEFIVLIESVDKLQHMDQRIQEKSPSLYHAISKGEEIDVLEGVLGKFFGDPVKPAGTPVPGALKRTHTFKHLGDIQADQSLFIKTIGEAELYGSLLPWPGKQNVITVHLGLCHPRLPAEDYQKIEQVIKDRMAQRISMQVDSSLGGQVQGISLSSFLQMSELERTTCILRVRSGGRTGILYLNDGQLVDAETDELKHLKAACSIIAWDNVTIEIQKTAGPAPRAINAPLMQILMASMQQKDEGEHAAGKPSKGEKKKKVKPSAKSTDGLAGEAPESKGESRDGQAESGEDEPIVPAEATAKDGGGPMDKTEEKPKPAPADADDLIDKTEEKPKPVPADADDLIDLELMDTGEKEKKALEKELERKKPAAPVLKPKNRKKMILIALAAVAVLVAAAFPAFNLFFGKPEPSEYETLLTNLSQLTDWDAKEKLLMGFINSHGPGAERQAAEIRLQEILVEAEDAYYRKITDGVNTLRLDRDYEANARELYAQFLEKYPNSTYRSDIEKDIPRIAKLAEDIHFSELKNIQANDYLARLKAYAHYLRVYPNGAYQEMVRTMMQDAANASYYDFKKSIQTCEKEKAWSACIQICDQYSSVFQSYLPMEAIQPIRERFQAKLDYETLMAKAMEADDAAAQKMYLAYMQQHPEAEENEAIRSIIAGMAQKDLGQRKWEDLKNKISRPDMDPATKMDLLQTYIMDNTSGPYVQQARILLRELETENAKLAQERYQAAQKIRAAEQARKEAQEQQVAQLKMQKERERIAQEKKKIVALLSKGRRFVVTGSDVATDQRTGLMWSLADSQLEHGRCMNHRSAVQYVKELRYGGYSDWRLPTSAELAGIYKNSPFFPVTGAEWYWTSESFAKGYHVEATIVTTKPETVFEKQSANTDACGAVRAVRP